MRINKVTQCLSSFSLVLMSRICTSCNRLLSLLHAHILLCLSLLFSIALPTTTLFFFQTKVSQQGNKWKPTSTVMYKIFILCLFFRSDELRLTGRQCVFAVAFDAFRNKKKWESGENSSLLGSSEDKI